MSRLVSAAGVLAAALSLQPLAAHAQAQSGKGWFVPQAAAPQGDAPHSVVRRAAPAPRPAPVQQPADDDQQAASNGAPPVLPLPPVPSVPEQPKASAPPSAVIGVLSVPDVMANSTAAQEIEKTLGARRDALQADAQKEQASWREVQQQIQSGKGLTQEQAQAKLRALQERVARAQRDFRERNRIIQEAAQVALGQVERTLVQVIKQVAAAHGMNLVLHREQVALSMPALDVTQNVADVLNKSLPRVFIPADGEDPEKLAKSGKFPTTADAPANATPAPQAVSAPK